MEMPFAPPGSPTLLEGAAALRRLYTGVVTSVRSIDLPVVDSQPFADPQWAMIEYTGKMIQPDGQDYTNHYHGLFRVVDGKIKVYRELYDTYRFAAQIPEEARHAMFRTSDEG
jgi:ketosteroid isomerase-like protein